MRQSVFLLDPENGRAVEAALTPLDAKHLSDWANEWKPYHERQISELRGAGLPAPEHAHWSWEEKAEAVKDLLSFQGLAIECNGMTQGMVFFDTDTHVCRLPIHRGKNLVYVNFLETAPWNRTVLSRARRFSGVGSILIGSAIEASLDAGYNGRTGLHSLRQADAFYRDSCGMTDLGPDPDYFDLRYFEMSEAQATAVTTKGRRP